MSRRLEHPDTFFDHFARFLVGSFLATMLVALWFGLGVLAVYAARGAGVLCVCYR